MVGLHHEGRFYEMVPWAGHVEWQVRPCPPSLSSNPLVASRHRVVEAKEGTATNNMDIAMAIVWFSHRGPFCISLVPSPLPLDPPVETRDSRASRSHRSRDVA